MILYFFGIIGLLIHLIGTYCLSYRDGTINGIFKGYLNFPCILYSNAVFLFFKSIPYIKCPKFILKLVEYYNPTTFSIYLVHWFVLDAFLKYKHWRYFELLGHRIFAAIVVFLVVGVCIRKFRKIDIIKKYIFP